MPKVSLQSARARESDILEKLGKVQQAAQSHKQQTKLNQQRHEWIEQARGLAREARRLEGDLKDAALELGIWPEDEELHSKAEVWLQVSGLRELVLQLSRRDPQRLRENPQQALQLQDALSSVAMAVRSPYWSAQASALEEDCASLRSKLRCELDALNDSRNSGAVEDRCDLSDEEDNLLQDIGDGEEDYRKELEDINVQVATSLTELEQELQELRRRRAGWDDESHFRGLSALNDLEHLAVESSDNQAARALAFCSEDSGRVAELVARTLRTLGATGATEEIDHRVGEDLQELTEMLKEDGVAAEWTLAPPGASFDEPQSLKSKTKQELLETLQAIADAEAEDEPDLLSGNDADGTNLHAVFTLANLEGLELILSGLKINRMNLCMPWLGSCSPNAVTAALCAASHIIQQEASLEATCRCLQCLPSIATPPAILEVSRAGEGSEEGDAKTSHLGILHEVSCPSDMTVALQTVESLKDPEATVTAVFGCDGEVSRKERVKYAWALAQSCAERIVLTSANCGTEPPLQVIEDMLEALRGVRRWMEEEMSKPLEVFVVVDRADAIKLGTITDSENSVTLVFGSGYKDFYEAPDEDGVVQAWLFNDRSLLTEALSLAGEMRKETTMPPWTKKPKANRRDLFMERLRLEFPHLKREELQQHEATCDALKYASQRQAAIFRQWRRDRLNLLRQHQQRLQKRLRALEAQQQRLQEMQEIKEKGKLLQGRLQVERQKAQAKREEMGRLQWGLAK
eukprot:g20240.t1